MGLGHQETSVPVVRPSVLAAVGPMVSQLAAAVATATAVFQSMLPGDHVLASRVLYWGVRKWLAEFGLTWGLDVESWAAGQGVSW